MIKRKTVKQMRSARDLLPEIFNWPTHEILRMRAEAARQMYSGGTLDMSIGVVKISMCEEVLNERDIV